MLLLLCVAKNISNGIDWFQNRHILMTFIFNIVTQNYDKNVNDLHMSSTCPLKKKLVPQSAPPETFQFHSK